MNPLYAIRRFAEMHALAVAIVLGIGILLGMGLVVVMAACIDRL